MIKKNKNFVHFACVSDQNQDNNQDNNDNDDNDDNDMIITSLVCEIKVDGMLRQAEVCLQKQ